MCGFTGFTTRSTPPDKDALKAMGDAIRHRGPDDEGYYTLVDTGIQKVDEVIIDYNGSYTK